MGGRVNSMRIGHCFLQKWPPTNEQQVDVEAHRNCHWNGFHIVISLGIQNHRAQMRVKVDSLGYICVKKEWIDIPKRKFHVPTFIFRGEHVLERLAKKKRQTLQCWTGSIFSFTEIFSFLLVKSCFWSPTGKARRTQLDWTHFVSVLNIWYQVIKPWPNLIPQLEVKQKKQARKVTKCCLLLGYLYMDNLKVLIFPLGCSGI